MLFMFCFVRIQWWLCQNPQRVYLFSQQLWNVGTVFEQGEARTHRSSNWRSFIYWSKVWFGPHHLSWCRINHTHPWVRTTLLQLQWTRPISWRGLEGIFHLMRWRYFIWTHPAKCKITRTEFNWKRSGSCNITQTSNQFLLSFSHFWELGNLRLSKGIFIETFTVNSLTLKTDFIVWICGEYWFTNSLP